MTVLRAYVAWFDNIMSPQPMQQKDLSFRILKRLRWSGTVVSIWCYAIILSAAIVSDYEGLIALVKPFQKNSILLLSLLSLIVVTSVGALLGMFYTASHRGLWRLLDSNLGLDEWEKTQIANTQKYGYWIAFITASTVVFTLIIKYFLVGWFSLSAMNVGLMFLMSAALQMFGGFALWAWRQEPLESE